MDYLLLWRLSYRKYQIENTNNLIPTITIRWLVFFCAKIKESEVIEENESKELSAAGTED